MSYRTLTAIGALLLAAVCVALVLARQPQRGLLLQRFSDESFQTPEGEPVVDTHVHFSSSDTSHPVPSWLKEHTSARWTGFIEIPREADYTLGVISDDGAFLSIDDVLVVDNGGLHGRRNKDTTLRLTQGYHAVRIDYFQAGGAATMKFAWHRSGNNTTYEIVPVSMLHPARPEAPSTAERGLRLAPWLLVFLAGWLVRPRAFPSRGTSRGLAYVAATAVFLCALGVRLHGLLDEGETCDQWTYVSAGYVYAQNIASGITDADQWAWNSEHPSIGKLVHGAVQFVFGTETWKVNAGAATLGALTVVTIFWVGFRLSGLATGIASGLILALIPSFVAHGRIATLDTPSTFFFTLAMAFLVRALDDERGRVWSFAAMTLATGLAIGTKFSNVFLLPLQFGGIVWLSWPALRKRQWPPVPKFLLAYPILILIPMLATWPWLWTSPIEHWNATRSHWQYVPSDVYLGTVAPPPWPYFFFAFLCTTPLGLFPFFLTGAAQAVRKSPELMSRMWWLLGLAWFAIPFAWTLAGFRMNGVRYILNVFPPLALVAGAGAVIAGQALGRRWSLGVPALTGVVTLYLLVTDWRIHPFYLDYFNEATGGAGHVQRKQLLDTGWWGEGLNQAVRWMNENAAPGSTYTVQAWSPPGVLLFRTDLRRQEHGPEYIVRQMQPIQPPDGYELVFEVVADGARIVGVFHRR